MLLEVHPSNPDDRVIEELVKILHKGGVIIYPTDTVYSFGCSLENKRAIERLAKLKGLRLKKANFSIIFSDLRHLSDYTKQIDRPTYKILNKNLPGPFTFILPANNSIPKLFDSNKKTVGIRIPASKIVMEIVEKLGHPLVTTSVRNDDDILEYDTDPNVIADNWLNEVDAIVDGGFGNNEASTVVDFTDGEPKILRQGIGELEL